MTLFELESARIVTLGHSGRVEESKSHKAHFAVTSATPAGATFTRHRIVVWVGLSNYLLIRTYEGETIMA